MLSNLKDKFKTEYFKNTFFGGIFRLNAN